MINVTEIKQTTALREANELLAAGHALIAVVPVTIADRLPGDGQSRSTPVDERTGHAFARHAVAYVFGVPVDVERGPSQALGEAPRQRERARRNGPVH